MEIVHGYWENCSNGWMCSVCNRDNRYDEDICPHCGESVYKVVDR